MQDDICNMEVASLINKNGYWDVNNINNRFPYDCVSDITSVPLPISSCCRTPLRGWEKAQGSFRYALVIILLLMPILITMWIMTEIGFGA